MSWKLTENSKKCDLRAETVICKLIVLISIHVPLHIKRPIQILWGAGCELGNLQSIKGCMPTSLKFKTELCIV